MFLLSGFKSCIKLGSGVFCSDEGIGNRGGIERTNELLLFRPIFGLLRMLLRILLRGLLRGLLGVLLRVMLCVRWRVMGRSGGGICGEFFCGFFGFY